MKSILNIGVLASFLLFVGCSSKSPVKVATKSSGNLAKDSVEATKTPAKSSVEGVTQSAKSGLPFFASIQILSESVAQGSCDMSLSLSQQESATFQAHEQEDGGLLVDSRLANLQSIINLQVRSMGFDDVRYKSTLFNNQATPRPPYGISVSLRPSDLVQVKFLDKVVQLKLDATPVYTFSVVESRGSCEITHNLNIFSERSGRKKITFKE